MRKSKRRADLYVQKQEDANGVLQRLHELSHNPKVSLLFPARESTEMGKGQ